MPHNRKLDAAVVIATAMVLGLAFGAGTAIAGHEMMNGSDVYQQHEGRRGPKPRE